MISSIVFWGSSTPARSITYTDSLFLTVSAMSLAGLNTVNLSEINTFQQILLFLLIMLGSAILVSSVVVHVRRKAFERRFEHIIEVERMKRKTRKNAGLGEARSLNDSGIPTGSDVRPEVDGIVVRGRAIPSSREDNKQVGDQNDPATAEQHLDNRARMHIDTIVGSDNDFDVANLRSSTSKDRCESSSQQNSHVSPAIKFASPVSPSVHRRPRRVFSMSGVGARPEMISLSNRTGNPVFDLPLAALTQDKDKLLHGTQKYFSSGGYVGRNSQFHSLTLAERESLGGVEYRALTLLEVIVPLYFILWQFLGCIGLGAWVALNAADTTLQNGLNPWYNCVYPYL